jgi:hypothetical protein
MTQNIFGDTSKESKEVAIFLLAILQATLNEQCSVKNISKWASKYVYNIVKDEASKQGWLE